MAYGACNMKVQLNTDKNIAGTEALQSNVETRLASALDRFVDQITRVEVHLSDESGPKVGGDDKRCMLEARLAGQQPIAVSHQASSVELAIDGAVERLMHAIETKLAKRDR